MTTIKTFVFFILVSISSIASANRCEWDYTFNRSYCCQNSQQAIWNEVFKRVECVTSYSGDSCVWNTNFRRIDCCQSNEHAVWNPLFHTRECFRDSED